MEVCTVTSLGIDPTKVNLTIVVVLLAITLHAFETKQAKQVRVNESSAKYTQYKIDSLSITLQYSIKPHYSICERMEVNHIGGDDDGTVVHLFGTPLTPFNATTPLAQHSRGDTAMDEATTNSLLLSDSEGNAEASDGSDEEGGETSEDGDDVDMDQFLMQEELLRGIRARLESWLTRLNRVDEAVFKTPGLTSSERLRLMGDSSLEAMLEEARGEKRRVRLQLTAGTPRTALASNIETLSRPVNGEIRAKKKEALAVMHKLSRLIRRLTDVMWDYLSGDED